ncbi:CPSF A subunit region-domain-containing protein [Absidia repens]|uniref:DNA damage-binding protein 1 n=1 Tax=Absidia repens TaxID=90262 RepID=A0A1X2IMQ1_9FUNG|nr:CPSF A subunit region-domain-containing protein [Absidia repens]
MSIYTYATTLQRATSVQTAIQGNFLSPLETNLIVSKGSLIEIYSLINDLLVPTLDFDLHCRIESLKAFTLPNQATCSLFILSEQQTFCVLHFDTITNTITTKAHGALEQKNARPNDDIFTVIDSENSTIMISAFTGLLFFIPLQPQPRHPTTIKGKNKDFDYPVLDLDPFDFRISEFNIKSMVAIEGLPMAAFAILYEQDDGMLLKFYQVNLPRKQISTRYTVSGSLEASCHLLVPVPLPSGGVLAIGEFTISYFDVSGHDCSLSIDTVVIKTYEFINDDLDDDKSIRCILGDTNGILYLLTLTTMVGIVTDLTIQYLSEAAACSAIVSLGQQMIYLGSPQGDSTLVKIENSDNRWFLTTMDEYPNLGPITDFCLYDLDKQGRQTMVCCSGANNDGTLRVVQSGIGFIERAVISMDGIEHIWSVASSKVFGKSQHDILVLSSIRETRLLYHPGEDHKYMDELRQFSAFDLDRPTMALGTFANGDILQVTVYEARLMTPSMDSSTGNIWKPQSTIVSAAVGSDYCVLSCGFGRLICLKVDYLNHSLVEVGNRKFDHEISCMSVFNSKRTGRPCAAVGFWGGNNIQILDLANLTTISANSVQDIPRSILFQTLEDDEYLFVALGDGKLIHYTVSPNTMQLLHQNVITIGTRSITLHAFSNNGENAVFAATDRPTIITSVRNRLVYSSVNLKNVRGFTVFNNPLWRDSLVMMTEQALLLGDLDPVRKLHFSKLPLAKKMGWRIAYHDDSQTIIVGTSQLRRNPDNGLEQKHGWVNVYDARTFQELEAFDLLEYELVETICTANIFNQDQYYIFVGTAITLPSEPDRSIGRILMYQVTFGRNYELVDTISIPGVVYCIKPYKDSIVAAVNGSIYYLDSYHPDAVQGEKLKISQKTHSNILALDLDTMGDSILVGDFMESMSLMKLEERNHHSKMTTIAKDGNVNWMTAVSITDSDVYIGAEMSHNLFTLQKPATTQTDTSVDEIMRMDVVGEYHIGDLINRMHRGTLADQIDPLEKKKSWTIMYATVNGAIGTLAGVTKEDYEILLTVQERILQLCPPIGGMNHAVWRTFYNGARSGESRNYIDGDLVEKFLTLSREQQNSVVESLPISVEQLQTKVEGLSQLR